MYEDQPQQEELQEEPTQELEVGIEYEEEAADGYLEGLLDQGNIVEELDASENADATQKIIGLYDEACRSMGKWLKKYKRAINLAKLQAMSGETEIEEKSFPFEGASLVMLPFVTEAMLDFNSRTAPELVWSENVAHGKIYGENSKEKEERAKRVSRYINYQLSEAMPNWRDEQDKLLMILPGPGTCYKKTYYNADKDEMASDLYLADEIKFNMDCKNFHDAPDKFIDRKYTRNEVIGFIRGEQQWNLVESELEENKEDFEYIEAYTWLSLDDDELKAPYTAIICKDSQKIVALYPYYDEDTINRNDDDEVVSIDTLDCFTQYRFLPDPDGGPMGLGWGILFGPMFDSINTNVRQLIDSGTLANTAANSGLIAMSTTNSRGNSVQAGPIEVQLGQLTPVPVRGNGGLAQDVVQFPFAGPNQTLFQLMEYLVQNARSMTNAALNVEANAGEAASLYLARLQQGLKVPNSITMRVYSAAKKELKKIGILNHKHFDDAKYNKVLDEQNQFSMEQDFDPADCDTALVSDPSQGSDIERVQRAQTVLEEAKQQPQQIINLRLAYLEWLKAMKTPNIEELAPEPDPNAQDPQQQMMFAQMQMEAELKKKDQELREAGQKLQEKKMVAEMAKTMADLGLKADEQEAKITKLYAETGKTLVEGGMATGNSALNVAQGIEDRFINHDEGVSNGREEAQQSITAPIGPMAGEPSNTGLSGMPEV
tara:strand:- start:182 stop:2323 length:2142 start_codon:yes stop_codon:yes gene_type:complete